METMGITWFIRAKGLGLSWGYTGIMEKRMETTIMAYIGTTIKGPYIYTYMLGLYRDNGKENGKLWGLYCWVNKGYIRVILG